MTLDTGDGMCAAEILVHVSFISSDGSNSGTQKLEYVMNRAASTNTPGIRWAGTSLGRPAFDFP
jgi:hypothetical protein